MSSSPALGLAPFSESPHLQAQAENWTMYGPCISSKYLEDAMKTPKSTVPRIAGPRGPRVVQKHKKAKSSTGSHLNLRHTMNFVLSYVFHSGTNKKRKAVDTNNLISCYEPSDAPFFRLPLEIREMIYHYALLPPEVYPHIMADDPRAVVVHYRKRNAHDRKYWGTEAMSRLLRVNRQIYQEASAVLYKAFPFSFPHYCSVETVKKFSEPLNLVARASIRSISLIAILRLAGLPKGNATAQWLDAFTLLARSLPGLRSVTLELAFTGVDVPDNETDNIIETALNLARPFRGVEKLTLCNHDKPGTQRTAIFGACQKRIGAGGFW